MTAEPQTPPEAPPGDAITVAYIHPSGETAYSWHHSLSQLVGYDFAHEARILRGGYVAVRYGTGGMTEARNKAVSKFLADCDAPWMLWLDTDMGFPADLAERLLEAADPAERPIVGALCFIQRESESDGMGGWQCTAAPGIFDWANLPTGSGYVVRWGYAANTLVRCNGTGSAAVLVHRSVFSRVSAKFGPHWYDTVVNPSTGDTVGEDLAFCIRANALEIPVHVHTGIPTTHMKRVWLGEPDYQRQRLSDVPSILRGVTRGFVFGKPVELAVSWPEGTPEDMDAEQLAKVADVMDAELGRLVAEPDRDPEPEPSGIAP